VRFWPSPPPELRQRAILAQDWIAVRQRHLGNRRQRLAAIGRIVATAQVICAVRRIGADDEEVVTAGQPLMPGACRQHDNIAGRELENLSVLSAELNSGVAARDAER